MLFRFFKWTVAFIVILLFFIMLGCDQGMMNQADKILVPEVQEPEPEMEQEPEIVEVVDGRKSIVEFYDLDELSKLQWVHEKDIEINYGYDPSGEPFGWELDTGLLIGRPSMLTIPLWILDPERNCMLLHDKTEVDGFIEPHQAEIFNWHTGEPYRFHTSLWDGQPPEPIVRTFWNVHTNKDTCPRRWFYKAALPIYLKYVEGDDKTSKELGLASEDIGVSITFENGEKLTWNLSEIYPELPPFPPFRFAEEGEL